MEIKPRFIQRNCIEGNEIDPRQANAILKYKPDIIVFEMPQGKNGPNTIFNIYPCNKKPIEKFNHIIKDLEISAKKYPYAASDILVWRNIKKMWNQGINTQIYNVDAPKAMRSRCFKFKKPYPSIRKDWLFWIYLYSREVVITKNIRALLENYHIKKDPTILIFLQSIHWNNVKFLLANPSKEEIWKHYFGNFKNIKPTKEIENQIKDRNKILNYYWKKVQIFY
ncbi:MAG: hypothetical protein PHW52_02870 [Candidatus Pacebacteria bacterium]|nr:hypothetical protein [Candidatus Paceibacterota bacterium]